MFKQYIIYSYICIFNFALSYSSTDRDFSEYPSHTDQTAKNFEHNKELISDLLSSVQHAQLNFFWTNGKNFSDNLDFQPHDQVYVGGVSYKDKFFSYLEQLLNHSPDKLSINFVCDKMTVLSNKQQIQGLQNKFNNRFKIKDIETVEKLMLAIFSEDNQQHKIKTIFQNATQGLPVITSDIYRLIALPYIDLSIYNKNEVLYTYSDIDIFCGGMERPKNDNQRLIESLFKADVVDSRQSFYLGRSLNNNDIIKIRISDDNAYKKFCNYTLDSIDIDTLVIRHFSNLHDIIRTCETQSLNDIDIKSLVPDRPIDFIREVVDTTGPNFEAIFAYMSFDLSYPSTTAGTWHTAIEKLDYRNSRNFQYKPINNLCWLDARKYNGIDEFYEIEERLDKVCDNYLNYVSAAQYALSFGKLHPFNIKIKEYLQHHFPYHSTAFQQLLQIHFDGSFQSVQQQSLKKSSSCPTRQSFYSQWKKGIEEELAEKSIHYNILQAILKTVDVNFSSLELRVNLNESEDFHS